MGSNVSLWYGRKIVGAKTMTRDLKIGDKIKFVYQGAIGINHPLEKDKIYEVESVDNSYTRFPVFYIKDVNHGHGQWCWDPQYFIRADERQQLSTQREKKWYNGY